MQNVVVNMCEKFHNDRLRNDGSSGNGKSDNKKKNKNNVGGAWRPVSGSKNQRRAAVAGAEASVTPAHRCQSLSLRRVGRIAFTFPRPTAFPVACM